MSLELYQLYPNARVNHDGSEGTVLDLNSSTVKIARDSGKVEEYTYDSVLADATPWESPEDKPEEPAAPTDVNPPVPVTQSPDPAAPQPQAPPENAGPVGPAPEAPTAPQPEAPAQPSEPSSPAADSRQQTN